MSGPDGARRPDGVPIKDWRQYLWLLSRAPLGAMEPRHFQELRALRAQYPQLAAEAHPGRPR